MERFRRPTQVCVPTGPPGGWDRCHQTSGRPGPISAEYDANDTLLRKFLYGPGVDQPICMIEVADSNAVYYYHFDGLGSVVALSDAAGDTVQTYEYSVYGEPAASDPNHTNPFLFIGRRFDPAVIPGPIDYPKTLQGYHLR